MEQQPQFTLEELMAEKQRRQQMKSQPQQPQQLNRSMPNNLAPQPQQNQDTMIGGLLDKISPGMRKSLFGALASGASGKVVDPSQEATGGLDMRKLYAQEAIKKQFEEPVDPTIRQLREAEIKSLEQPLPEGLTRVGRQVVSDPAYVKPKDQAEMDAAVAQKDSETQSLRASAEDNLATIQKVKEGAEFFGPYGNIPSIADPQSMLGLNQEHYGNRKEWENNTNKLLSQKVIDIISEMKRVSKTGATGFGQLSEKEGAILQQASTALSKDLPKEQALYYLNEMEKIHKKVLGGGQGNQLGGIVQGADGKQYRIVGGDPNDPDVEPV